MFSCSRKWLLQSEYDSSVVGSCCTMYTEFVQSVFFRHDLLNQNPLNSLFSSYVIDSIVVPLHTHKTLCIFVRSHGSWIVSGYFFYPSSTQLSNLFIHSIIFKHCVSIALILQVAKNRKPTTDSNQEKNMLNVAHFFPPH